MPPSSSSGAAVDAEGAVATAPLLTVGGLRVSYGSAVVLDGVDLIVRRGEMVGLAGRNGVGKTTTLRAISGMVPLRGGSVEFEGRALPRRPEAAVRAGVAHVPEGRRLFASLTVEENLRAAAAGAGGDLDPELRERVLQLFPALEKLLGRRAGYLSGGEQQMVAISRGIAARPALLMIDEVSLGLAPRLVGDMWRALDDLRGPELALLVVDQNVRIMAAHCDRVLLLDDGRVREASAAAGEGEMRSLYFD